MARYPDDVDERDDDELEQETILFKGALNGKDANLRANAKLARAGLLPSKQLLGNALDRRAEVVLIEPKGAHTLVRFLIDGVAYPGARFPRQRGLAITQMIKLLAGLDIQQRRKPQSGGINAELNETPYRLRVESTPLGEGAERLTVRVENLNQDFESPDGAGFPRELRTRVREYTSGKTGAVLICGPPNSGTTTTTYAVLRSVDAYMLSIYSLTDMGDRDLFHITMYEPYSEEPTFQETLDRLHRIEADVLFMDPIHNAEAARKLFLAAERFAVVSEFTAKDAAHGIVQLCQWLGDAQKVADGLSAIFSQKLIRLLCEECRAAFRPNPKLLAQLGLPKTTKTLYRAVTAANRPAGDEDDEEWEPCEKCNGLGYYGRTALFEMIEMTDEMKQLIVQNPNPSKIKTLARESDMPTLQKTGLDLVAQGRTSLEELKRVFKTS